MNAVKAHTMRAAMSASTLWEATRVIAKQTTPWTSPQIGHAWVNRNCKSCLCESYHFIDLGQALEVWIGGGSTKV
jgi:hypothetical protein